MLKYYPKQKLTLNDPMTGESISGKVVATVSFIDKIWVAWDNGIFNAYSLQWLDRNTSIIS
jgi:hypothetical protein